MDKLLRILLLARVVRLAAPYLLGFIGGLLVLGLGGFGMPLGIALLLFLAVSAGIVRAFRGSSPPEDTSSHNRFTRNRDRNR